MRQKFEFEVRLIRHSNVRVCMWIDPKSKSDRFKCKSHVSHARPGRYGRGRGRKPAQPHAHVCKQGQRFCSDLFSAGNRKTAAEPPCGSCKFLSTFLSFVSVRLYFVSFHFSHLGGNVTAADSCQRTWMASALSFMFSCQKRLIRWRQGYLPVLAVPYPARPVGFFHNFLEFIL